MVKMALCNCIQISTLLLLMFQPLHINQSYLVEETKCIKGQLDEFATLRHFFFFSHQRSHWGHFLPPETIKGSIIFRGRTGRLKKPRLAVAEVQDKGSATLRWIISLCSPLRDLLLRCTFAPLCALLTDQSGIFKYQQSKLYWTSILFLGERYMEVIKLSPGSWYVHQKELNAADCNAKTGDHVKGSRTFIPWCKSLQWHVCLCNQKMVICVHVQEFCFMYC